MIAYQVNLKGSAKNFLVLRKPLIIKHLSFTTVKDQFNTRYPWKTYVYNFDGIILNAAWPKNYGKYSPSFNDFDDDDLEIVTVDGEINIWNIDGTLVNGWPYIFSEGGSHSCPPRLILMTMNFLKYVPGMIK